MPFGEKLHDFIFGLVDLQISRLKSRMSMVRELHSCSFWISSLPTNFSSD